MMATILAWLGGKLAGPIACACAVLFAMAALVQTARIDGVPLLGGGLKADVAGLQAQLAARDLAEAKAQAALLAARQQVAAKADAEAGAQAAQQAKTQTQIETVIEKVPVYVTAKSDAACRLPWGFVRLFDAAASGADPDDIRARIAPGQPDDAASDITLSEAATLLAADLGIARQNAGQLEHLERAVAATNGSE
jgi:hypothetical protein